MRSYLSFPQPATPTRSPVLKSRLLLQKPAFSPLITLTVCSLNQRVDGGPGDFSIRDFPLRLRECAFLLRSVTDRRYGFLDPFILSKSSSPFVCVR